MSFLRPIPFALAVLSLAAPGAAHAHVSLVYPTGGETLVAGTRVTVEWTEDIAHDAQNWDLYWSPDGGVTWIPIQLDVPYASRTFEWDVPTTATAAGRIRVVQDNSGLDYQADSGDFTVEGTVTATEDAADVPGRHLLVSGYPNPFSGSVEITVSVHRSGRVKVDVYDVLGNRVAVLADAEATAGSLRIPWSADRLPPGLYLARVVQAGETATLALVRGR